MRKDCTDSFLRHSEIARLIWNLGFWPDPTLRAWDSVELYEDIAFRLFEGMVLHPLGYQADIYDRSYPGKTAEFTVEVRREVDLLVNKNPPGEPGQVWGHPVIRLKPDGQRLRFMGFFEWYQLAPREFRLIEVLIERMDSRPEVVGRHGLVELAQCSIWFEGGPSGNGSRRQ